MLVIKSKTRNSLNLKKANVIIAVDLKVKFFISEGFKNLLDILLLINDTKTRFSKNGKCKNKHCSPNSNSAWCDRFK